jgi:hypothetical protein
VAIDVEDGPTMVSLAGTDFGAITRSFGIPGGAEIAFGGGRFLCETPCVVDLPFGSHRLRFRRGDDADEASIIVGRRPSVYRRALGYRRAPSPWTSVGGMTAVGLGIPGLLTGPLLIGEKSASTAGIALTAASGALSVLGGVLLAQYRDTIQPGAAVQWEPADGVIYTQAR